MQSSVRTNPAAWPRNLGDAPASAKAGMGESRCSTLSSWVWCRIKESVQAGLYCERLDMTSLIQYFYDLAICETEELTGKLCSWTYGLVQDARNESKGLRFSSKWSTHINHWHLKNWRAALVAGEHNRWKSVLDEVSNMLFGKACSTDWSFLLLVSFATMVAQRFAWTELSTDNLLRRKHLSSITEEEL